jgi:hypothetical protein
MSPTITELLDGVDGVSRAEARIKRTEPELQRLRQDLVDLTNKVSEMEEGLLDDNELIRRWRHHANNAYDRLRLPSEVRDAVMSRLAQRDNDLTRRDLQNLVLDCMRRANVAKEE